MAKNQFDDMPELKLEQDDVESFQRTRAQTTKKPSKNDKVQDEARSPSNSPSWFAFVFLLVVIIAGASYWSFEQYKVMVQAQSRITELEGRLSATGEDMDQSAAALQVKVSELSAKTQELWEQMDKLWASAWRRNQADITTLNKTVEALKASSEKISSALTTDTSENATTIAVVQEQLENQSSLLKQIDEKVNLAGNLDSDLEQQLASLREKVISTALANNDLTNQIDDLNRRLSTAEKKVNESKSTPSPTPQL